MAGSLAKYGFINAKLRTRLSKILSMDFFNRLIRAPSLTEAIHLFHNTAFSGIESIYNRTGDIKLIELELFKQEILLYLELERYVGGQVLDMIRALTTRYEIDNLKNILRIWFDSAVRKRDISDVLPYIYREKIHHDLNIDQIIRAQNLDQVADYLGQTPYSDIIKRGKTDVQNKNSIFPAEIGLDQYFYAQLLKNIEDLAATDSAMAHRLMGIEIDIQNITLILRFKTMYNMPLEQALKYTLPQGLKIDKNTISQAYEAQNISDILTGILGKTYSGIGSLLSSPTTESYGRFIIIERILEQIMQKEIRRVLFGNPFTVGIILVYFILKRSEIRKIITIINAKYYSIPEERVLGYL